MWARPLTNFQTTNHAQEVVRKRRVHVFENTYAQLVYSISVRAHGRVSGVEADADKVLLVGQGKETVRNLARMGEVLEEGEDMADEERRNCRGESRGKG